MLLLLPSAIYVSILIILERLEANGETIGMSLGMIALAGLAIAVTLCFALGFLVERWRHGKIKSLVWALDYGFLILVGNALIVFAAEKALGFLELQ